jgi:cytochrome c peroxidase
MNDRSTLNWSLGVLLFAVCAPTHAAEPPLGLPALSEPQASKASIDLGRKLFFDRRLSFNGTLSCGMCHVPEQAFTQNELATPVGFGGLSVKRNAPALYNVAYRPRLFHDGRESSLELQIWSPLLAANEMGNPSIGSVLERIAALPEYTKGFADAFADTPNVTNVGQALAAYERTLVSADSAFDRWYFGKEQSALTTQQRRGFAAFGARGCIACHTIDERSAQFTDEVYHDTGIGYAASMQAAPKQLQLAPGEVVTLTTDVQVPIANDLGRYEATLQPTDRWRYRTPTLRNVAITAPYMHDGSLASLEAVIDHYAAGGVAHDGLDPLLKPFTLADQERADLVAFLQSLTGSNVAALAADARTAPVGDR